MALGVAISTKSNLGTSPTSSVPYVLSLITSFTMGQITIFWNILLVFVQILLLRKNFQPIQLLQIVVSIIFGYFTDSTIALVSGLSANTYIMRWVFCLASFFMVALGVFMEVQANVLMLPGEGVSTAVAKVTKIEFPKVKIGVDITWVVLASLFSLIGSGKLQGVREGTVASAICIGMIVKLYGKLFGDKIDKLLKN